MACKTEEKKIDGIGYVCTQLPALSGGLLKLKLIDMFGSAAPLFIKAITKKEGNDINDQLTSLIEAVESVFKKKSPNDVFDLITDTLVMDGLCRDGVKFTDKSMIDLHFSGDDLKSLYKVFFFVVKVNYAGFFKSKEAQEAISKMEKL